MPTLHHDRAIREYYNEVKDKYPDMSFEEFAEICRSPFKAIRDWLKDIRLPVIYLKYLGTLRVYKGTIRWMLKNLHIHETMLSNENFISQRAYLQEYLTMLERENTESDLEIIDDVD